MADTSGRPDIEALVGCARMFAQALGVATVPDAAARAVIKEVLFGQKDGWACCELGIITRDELMNLLLAHLQTELEPDAAPTQYPQGTPWERPELRDALRKALFGA